MSDRTIETETDAVIVEAPRRDFASSLGAAVQDNPASAALIAMGAVWLFAGGSRVSLLGGRRGEARTPRSYPAAYPAPSVVGLHAEGAATAAEDVSRTAGDAARGAGHAAQHAGRKAGDVAERTGAAAGEAAHRAAELAGDVAAGMSAGARQTGAALSTAGTRASRATRRTATSAWHEAEDLGRSVRETLEDRPLAIAALGLAAGAGLAFALPRTDAERKLMGERSEALRERARSLASERLEAAREGGEAALARAIRDARANGLSESAVKAAVEEFTAKLEKVAVASRDAAKSESPGA